MHPRFVVVLGAALVATACKTPESERVEVSLADCTDVPGGLSELHGDIELVEPNHAYDRVFAGIAAFPAGSSFAITLHVCAFDGWWENWTTLNLVAPGSGSGDVVFDEQQPSTWTDDEIATVWSVDGGSGSVGPIDMEAETVVMDIQVNGPLIASVLPEEPESIYGEIKIDATWAVEEDTGE